MPDPLRPPELPVTQPPRVAPAGASGISGMLGVLVAAVVVAALYFGRTVLLPITLAVLLSFLLSPLVEVLRRLWLGRILSVLLAVVLALGVILGLGSAIECLAQNLYVSPPALSQHAAIAAFECLTELDANVARYAENRALLLRELAAAGFDRLAPSDGAFYLYADVAHRTNDSEALCRQLLHETGVALTPGTDFDPRRGRATLRLCYAGSPAIVAEAARRLKAWRG